MGSGEIDSDGDGLTDAVELEYGTNPLNRRTLVLFWIQFVLIRVVKDM